MAMSSIIIILICLIIILIAVLAPLVLLFKMRDKLLSIETVQLAFNQHLDRVSQQLVGQKQALKDSHFEQQKLLVEKLVEIKLQQHNYLHDFRERLLGALQLYRSEFDKRQLEGLQILQDSLQKSMNDVRAQVVTTLTANAENLGRQMEGLTRQTDERLKIISNQVEKRLSEGFEKTTATFTDVLKRLALIDEAQKKITELSSNVVSLQEVLSDKQARGAFGEVQLNALIRNTMPDSSFAFQCRLSNDKRADCILFLPEPTGHIVIDAKFPLENYRVMTDIKSNDGQRRIAEQQFRQDIKKHIYDISEKYIIAGETSDGAIMFIPAEAVFAEIHGHFPELIELAHKARVWMASPTTMMAILTTARAALKDADTRKQVHVIQEHLGYLAKDFDRFKKRMENLARHIQQANDDVKDVRTSARKIATRFQKIEKVELEALEADITDDTTEGTSEQ